MESLAPLRIVTIAYNPGEELVAMAKSLPDALSVPWELVVVNNGAESDIVSQLENDGATVLRPGANLGYGRAANLGLEGATGTWGMVVNPDVVFTPGSIDALIDGAKKWPRGGVFGPLIRTPEGEIYPSARKFPRLISGVGHALLANVWPNNPATRAYRENTAVDRAHVVDWLSGSCMFLRMKAFREAGGFDDSYFMFFEDTQLGEDMAAAGWQCVFLPNAEIMHEQGSSWKERPARMLRAHHRSAAHYLDGVYSRPYQAPLRLLLRAGLRVRGELQVWLANRGK